MANPEHVEIVKRGAPAIARWQRQHPRERLDLSAADLSGAHLSGADLKRADLREADLRRADLSRADLSKAFLVEARLRGAYLSKAKLRGATLGWANLKGAGLVEADLSSANLTEADLRWAKLIGADLSRAVLRGVDLMWADLHGADLSRAECGITAFARCDLSQVRGLETVDHQAPSSIGVDTLALTLQGAGGQFTREQRTFFENAGVPKTLLDYLPSLLESHPIQFFSCFISYGTPDEKFADRLYRDLKERGISCWKYDEDALVGRGVWANIDRAIAAHEKAVVICSESSLQRPGVQREIERALQREDELTSRQAAQPDVKIDTDVLFPVRLDDYVLEGWEHPRKADVIAKHMGDFRGWDKDDANYKRGLEQLLRALDPHSKLGLSKGDLRELAQG